MAAPPDPIHPPDSARERLLQAGLRLFAQRGYSQTSTRELAEAAHVNVAAISYYFGDKAGLYRAVFFGPSGSADADVARFSDPALSLPEALRGFYQGFLEPLRQSDDARLCTKLHFREILEPTGLWDEQLAHGIRPLHDALVALLQRQLGVAEPDDELQALAICLTAPGVHLHVAHDITAQLAPALQHGGAAIDRWSERLVRLGVAMVDAERARRAAPNEAPSP